MGIRSASGASHVTLVGTTLLHSFTHALANMLPPLYLMMAASLGFANVSRITLLVTVYGVTYWVLSWPAGLLADRYNRVVLLGVGLLGNACAVAAMGLTHSYPVLVVLCLIAGMFGSLFHPSANALIPAHYPAAPAMAIGLLGIGSGVGFFAGPYFSGMIAQQSTLLPDVLANWQRPCIYLGLGGILCAVLFLLTAREAPHHQATKRPLLPPMLRRRTLAHACVIALREFSIVGVTTLTALFFLKVHGFDPQRTGRYLGLAMLAGAVVNPIMVYLTAGKRRLPAHAVLLVLNAIVVVTIPFVPASAVLYPLLIVQTLGLASSAVGDAGLTERVEPHFRGRVNGMLLTIVGVSGASGPWVAGVAVDHLGDRAHTAAAYIPLYATPGLLLLAATASAYTMSRLLLTVPQSSPTPIPAPLQGVTP